MADEILKIRPASETKWDCVSLGEVMLRLDPGFGRVRTARSFQVWEGGGEYNVCRAFRKCWKKRSSVVTALPINDVGWLVEDLIMQGGVDPTEESLTKWYKAGIVASGIGSKLITKEVLAAKDFGAIEKKVAETIAIIKKIRSEKKK